MLGFSALMEQVDPQREELSEFLAYSFNNRRQGAKTLGAAEAIQIYQLARQKFPAIVTEQVFRAAETAAKQQTQLSLQQFEAFLAQ